MGRHTREQREGYIEARKKINPPQASAYLRRPNQTEPAMAPPHGVIDLTEDDDEPTASRTSRASHGGQSTSHHARNPAIKGSNPNRDRPAASISTPRSSGATLDITSAPTKDSQSADRRRSLNDGSQASSRVDAPRSQNTQNRRVLESDAKSSKTRGQSLEKRVSGEIDLTESDDTDLSERPLPKQFRLPREYDATSLSTPPSQASNLRSTVKESSPSKRKRPNDSESPSKNLSNRSSPFKKQRLGQQDSDEQANLSTQNGTHAGTKIRREAGFSSAAISSTNRTTPGTHQNADSTSPFRAKETRTARDRKDHINAGGTPKKHTSPPAALANGKTSQPSLPSKRKDDQESSKSLDSSILTSKKKQQEREQRSSPKLSQPSGDLGSIPFRKQRTPHYEESLFVSGGNTPASTGGRKDPGPKPPLSQKERASVSASKESTDANTPIRHHDSAIDGQKNSSEPSSKGRLASPANQNSTKTTGPSEANGGSIRRATPEAMAPNSGTRSSRKTPLQEDGDDASVISEVRNPSNKKARKDAGGASVREPSGTASSSLGVAKSSDPSVKTNGGKEGPILTNDPENPRALDKASELSKACVDVASATKTKVPASGQSSSQGAASSSRPQTNELTNSHADTSRTSSSKSSHMNLEESSLPQQTARKSFTEAEEADLQLQREAMQEDMVNKAQEVFVPPTISASALRASSMFSNLPLANRVEKVLGKYLEELRGDDEYWTGVDMRRARLSVDEDTMKAFAESAMTGSEQPTSFAHIKPLNFPIHKKIGSSTKSDEEVWQIQRITADGKSQPHVDRSAKYVTFTTDTADVPDYAHYISIKNNILAPNVIHLHCWPYFSDDFEMSRAENLHGQYTIDIVERERKLVLLQQAQKYEPYVESALQDLECSWADVLRFLLEAAPAVGPDLDARKAYQNRSQYCEQDFNRNSDRWVAVLSSLPPSTPDKLGRAAVLCENFQKLTKFSLWHVARRSEFADLPEDSTPSVPPQPSDDELTCRICLRFNCPYHGQFKHHAEDRGSDSENESLSDVESVVATDIVHPLRANYRSRIAFPPADSPNMPESNPDAPLKKRQKDPNYWNAYKNKAEDRGPFYPCNHPGSACEDAKCRCFERNIPCEKLCGCSAACPRKFKGCSCGLRKGHKLVCFEDAECACYQLGRECDPDLCGTCGVCDVVDPVNKYNDGILIGRCRNASIQRGVPKHTLLGDSGVHGLGLYACEHIKQNDFVGEYKGEIITKREADRRGAVYEHQKLSYLFSLNKAQEIDSTYFGNKVRFINHAHGDKANLYPRIIMVNTVHRIALYAGKDIVAGKELLFDYGPYFPDDQLQGKKSKKSAPPESKKSAPHVRNANLVKEFFDVEESEDEDGNLRAKAVSHRAAGTKGRANGRKPRGGARPNAGRKPLPEKTAGRENLQNRSTEADRGPNAEERLATFNISDDLSSGHMEVDLDWRADDDEAFEPDGSESDDSEDSGESERSDEFDGDDDEDELDQLRTSARRAAVNTRGRG